MSAILPDKSNELFTLAADFVNNTSRHVFLTGKAGTGKTTFLRFIKDTTQKNVVVAAPTGVAAINAGGTTLHSMFQLPFGPFIPVNNRGFSGDSKVTDQGGLLKQLRLNGSKRELLQEMELLIIDEVSMMRADMLDAIDTILRSVRKNHHAPFGGVQVLYIGDLYQLPPVVPNEEWEILSKHYRSPFFFDSKVIEQSPPLYIELKKIYRQNEQHFIDILNRIRNNLTLPEDLQELNARALNQDESLIQDHTITLTTHNKKADAINAAELAKLPGQLYRFEGTIDKEFPEFALPTDLSLTLKVGAQVMFIKNDTGEKRKFFNGKLAEVCRIEKDIIYVIPFGEEKELQLEKETWKNIRYSYDKEKDQIEEEEIGSFTQYPLRLAWAITIHKSQGLTFEKAIIDAGQAFAAGQVYVALSRCTSLDGLKLSSKIYSSAIQTNPLVIEFAQRESGAHEMNNILEKERRVFAISKLFSLFEWKKILEETEALRELALSKQFPGKEDAILKINAMIDKCIEQQEVAFRFVAQLRNFAFHDESFNESGLLSDRLTKALHWFTASIYKDLIEPLHMHAGSLQGTSRIKQYMEGVLETITVFWNKLTQLQNASFPDLGFQGIESRYSKEMLPVVKIEPKKAKAAKGSSQLESLDLFKEGKSVQEIATQRNLAISTIEGHLTHFVLTGELDPLDLISQEKFETIREAFVEAKPEEGHSAIKQKLGDNYSFNDLRIVTNYTKRMKELEEQ